MFQHVIKSAEAFYIVLMYRKPGNAFRQGFEGLAQTALGRGMRLTLQITTGLGNYVCTHTSIHSPRYSVQICCTRYGISRPNAVKEESNIC